MGCYLLLLFFLACSGCFPVHPCRYLPAVCCASASQPGAHSVPQCWALKAELWASISWGGTATNPAVVKSRCHPRAPPTPKPSDSSLLRRGKQRVQQEESTQQFLDDTKAFDSETCQKGPAPRGKEGPLLCPDTLRYTRNTGQADVRDEGCRDALPRYLLLSTKPIPEATAFFK